MVWWVTVVIGLMGITQLSNSCVMGVGGGSGGRDRVVVEVVKPLLTMVAKQTSVNLGAVDEQMTHVQLSGQVESVALQGRVLDDV